MQPTPSTPAAPRAPLPAKAAAVSAVDLSCRVPVLVLFISAAKWLVIAWVFQLIASIKFHNPAFLADSAWLTYGRVHPAFTNSLIYGCCVQAGLGVALWLLAHLGAVPLAGRGLVTIGAGLWNSGVLIGIIGILAGDSTGFEYLEMPSYAAAIAFLGYLLMGLWAVVTFHQRRERSLSAPHWFLFTAIFWFPWVYSTAYLLLVRFPVRGITQAVIGWWFAQNLLVVWLALVGLAALFHFVPKLLGRELSGRQLALFAYWMIILFAGWGGIPGSAPVPAWMPTLSTIGTVLSVLAVIAVALNLGQVCGRSVTAARGNPPLGFFFFSTAAFILAGVLRPACVLLDTTQDLHFTWFGPALVNLNLYGFFAMAMFGAVYFIAPRLLGTAFPWPRFVRAHLWLSMAGIVLIVLPLAVAGIIEKVQLGANTQPFLTIARSALPFLRASTLGDLLLLIGHALFLANLAGLALSYYRTQAVEAYSEMTEDLFKTAGAGS